VAHLRDAALEIWKKSNMDLQWKYDQNCQKCCFITKI